MNEQLAALIFSSTRDVMWVGLTPLVLLLLSAAWSDWRQRRIPNGLVAAGIALALAFHLGLPPGEGFASQLPGGLGLLPSLEGLAIGLVLLFPCYVLRVLGAGDVKLVAMVGAFLGPSQFWGALLCIALTGGLLALVVALRHRVLGEMLANVGHMLTVGFLESASGTLPRLDFLQPSARLPYGVAVAVGTCLYLSYTLYRIGVL